MGQVSLDTLEKLMYEFDLAVIENDSKILQSYGNEIVSELPNVDDLEYQILIWLVNSELQMHLGDMVKSQECLKKSNELYKSDPNSISLNTIAAIYADKALYDGLSGDFVAQEANLDTCLTILQQEDKRNHFDIASAYQKLCYLYYNKGQVIKSIDLLEMAESEMKQLMGIGEVEKSDFSNINRLDSLLLANVFNDIAFLNGSTGNNDKAIPYYRQALVYNPNAWSVTLNLVNNLRYEGDHKTANLLAKELIENTGEDRPDIKARAMLAMIAIIGTSEKYLYENPEEEMISYFDKIKEYHKSLPKSSYPYDAAAAGVLCDYFRRVCKQRDYEKASYYLNEQKVILEEKGKLIQNTSIHTFLATHKSRKAQLNWVSKNYESAEENFQDLITHYLGKEEATVDEIIDMMLQKEYLKKLMIDCVRMNAIQGVEIGSEYFNQANEKYLMIDTAVDSLLAFNEVKIEADAVEELHKVGFGLSLKQFESTNDEKYQYEAYRRFEKLSTLTSYRHHMLTSLQYSNERDSELKKRKNKLVEEMEILEGMVSEDEEEQKRIQKSLDSLNSQFIDISESLSVATNSFKDRSEKNKSASLGQLQLSMAADELYYHLALDRITEEVYILLVTKDQIKSKILKINDLRFQIDQVITSLSVPNSNEYHHLLKSFYKKFITPFEELIENKKLIFVPGQDLAMLPFGLMIDKHEEYLCFKNPILYKYSSSWQGKEVNSQASRFLAFASSDEVTKDGESRSDFLSAALREVSLLEEKYGASIIQTPKNPKKAFLNQSKEAKVLHVAVHSNIEPLNPIKSSLLLSSDGNKNEQLYYHEIDDLELSSELVLLSSCQSGLGYANNAGSVSSLARAFQLAGAKNLIQTMWSINDESTSALMEIFYRKLDEGNPISVSLAQAKMEFLHKAPANWQHPYYWGAFVLNGEDGVIKLPKIQIWQSSTIGLIGIMSMLLLLIFAKYNTKISRPPVSAKR